MIIIVVIIANVLVYYTISNGTHNYVMLITILITIFRWWKVPTSL